MNVISNIPVLFNSQPEDVNITAIEVTEPQINSYVIGADVGLKGSWHAGKRGTGGRFVHCV